jgi:hypothetical protein
MRTESATVVNGIDMSTNATESHQKILALVIIANRTRTMLGLIFSRNH